jgi:hypothetical protein
MHDHNTMFSIVLAAHTVYQYTGREDPENLIDAGKKPWY